MFIEQKDNISQPLFPGRVIDIPVAVDPDNTTPVPVVNSLSHKNTSVQDKEEPVTSDWVWTYDTKVPVLLPHNPADISVPADDIVPIPALDLDAVPRCSNQPQVLTPKVAEPLGIQHVPHVTQAVAESREAGHRLKEQHAQAKFEASTSFGSMHLPYEWGSYTSHPC